MKFTFKITCYHCILVQAIVFIKKCFGVIIKYVAKFLHIYYFDAKKYFKNFIKYVPKWFLLFGKIHKNFIF